MSMKKEDRPGYRKAPTFEFIPDDPRWAHARDVGTTRFFNGHVIYVGDIYYTPFLTSDGRVGYRVTRVSEDMDGVEVGGEEEFIYFNPSDHSDGDVPNVFVYIGGDNDPVMDAAQHHYLLFGGA